MSTELYWLALTLLMTALFWLPYILDRMAVRGMVTAVTDTGPETGSPHSVWAKRAMKAHGNAVENFVVFAPAIFMVQTLGVSSPATRGAAMVYFFARLVHFIVYTFGIPVVRTLAFAVGWGATVTLILASLRWI